MAIRTLASAKPEDREIFLRAFGKEDATPDEVARAIRVMEGTGAVASSRATAEEYAARAEARLRRLPPSEHREFLRGLIYYMIARDH
jgi:geranylgeranyl pyrophosphate synthase